MNFEQTPKIGISQRPHWMAYLRAVESERPDAVLHDPYARQLAGSRGESVANSIGSIDLIASAFAIQTALLDRLIVDCIARHDVDLVLNLGSGLDTRPWRLELPRNLQWLDVDQPGLLDHKASVLSKHSPVCSYQAIGAEVLVSDQRVAAINTYPYVQRTLVVTDGLLAYLHPDEVEALAQDLHGQSSCRWWLTDLVGSNAVHALCDCVAPGLAALNFQFAPDDSARFFSPLGWRELAFYTASGEARRLNRTARTPALVRLGMILRSPGAQEEFRGVAGVASLVRQDLKLPGCSSP